MPTPLSPATMQLLAMNARGEVDLRCMDTVPGRVLGDIPEDLHDKRIGKDLELLQFLALAVTVNISTAGNQRPHGDPDRRVDPDLLVFTGELYLPLQPPQIVPDVVEQRRGRLLPATSASALSACIRSPASVSSISRRVTLFIRCSFFLASRRARSACRRVPICPVTTDRMQNFPPNSNGIKRDIRVEKRPVPARMHPVERDTGTLLHLPVVLLHEIHPTVNRSRLESRREVHRGMA